jgi:hypothetical protein
MKVKGEGEEMVNTNVGRARRPATADTPPSDWHASPRDRHIPTAAKWLAAITPNFLTPDYPLSLSVFVLKTPPPTLTPDP